MKKNVIIIAAVVLAVAIIAVGAIFVIPAITGGKNSTPVIKVGSETVSSGKTVKVPVTISENPGFMAILLEFEYDTKLLKYVNYSEGSFLDDYNISEKDGVIKFLSLGDKDIKKNGEIVYLEFEAIGAAGSEAEIKLNLAEGSICNFDEEVIKGKAENGKITIK